jgi:hypothetical protein
LSSTDSAIKTHRDWRSDVEPTLTQLEWQLKILRETQGQTAETGHIDAELRQARRIQERWRVFQRLVEVWNPLS